ncbi:MAG: RnfABCDGE type electron transport complex subunit D, partial [Victivallales bacterium]
MSANRGLAKYLQRQPINRRVILALLPCVMAAIYYFGWRSLAMVLWAAVAGFITEYAFTRKHKEPVSEAVFVTSTIFALIMPPTVGWHIMAIGMVFAIAFSKEVFGGFGKNFFNPAMAGFCFVYICFPVALTSTWTSPATGPFGALKQWSAASAPDAITSATPMSNLKAGRLILDGTQKPASAIIPLNIQEGQKVHVEKTVFLRGLVFGNISGTMGVTSVIAVCMGGIYLFMTKTANRSIILSLIITYGLLSQTLFWFGVKPVPEALTAVL